MPIRSLLCAWCVLLTVSATAEAQFTVQPDVVPAEDFHVELALMGWRPTPELEITTPAFNPLGGTVDFIETFGFPHKRFPDYRVVIKPGRKHRLRFSRVEFAYQEDAVVQGVSGTADVTWELWRAGYEYDLISRSHGFLGVIGELKYNKVNASIATNFGSLVTEQKVPLPTVGGIARGYLGDYASITGEFTMLTVDRDGDFRGKFWDLDVYGTAHFGRSLGVQTGYRSVVTDYLVDDDQGDLKMQGWYFGGLVRF